MYLYLGWDCGQKLLDRVKGLQASWRSGPPSSTHPPTHHSGFAALFLELQSVFWQFTAQMVEKNSSLVRNPSKSQVYERIFLLLGQFNKWFLSTWPSCPGGVIFTAQLWLPTGVWIKTKFLTSPQAVGGPTPADSSSLILLKPHSRLCPEAMWSVEENYPRESHLWVTGWCCTQIRGWQTFSAKCQIVNFLGVAGHRV